MSCSNGLLVTICCVLGFSLGLFTVWGVTQDYYKRAAIEAGVAHYVCDSTTSICEFTYKVCKK